MEAIELTILAIDDNRDNLTTVKAVVSDRLPGARILTARGGPKGLELALAEDPDVILLDIVMPDMDGFAVCRRLKEDHRLQTIPVVFLTALRTDRESRIRALEVGAEGFLLKPFDEVELVAQIRAMAKIKAANVHKLREKEQLAALVDKRTRELNQELAERQQAEKALKESEARYRRITESLTDYLYTVRVENGCAVETRHSPACLAVTGYSAEDFAADPYLWIRMVTPDDQELLKARTQQILEGQDIPSAIEHKIIRKDGAMRWVSDNIILHRNDAGVLQSYDGVVKDIHEHKQAEMALRESEDRLAFAMHMSHTGAWELNLLENTVQRTDIHDRIFGYETLLPHWTYEVFLDHVLPEDRPEVDQLFQEAVAEKSEWNFQCRIRRSDGEVRWIWAAGTHRLNREGNPALMGIVQDITESKHAKEEEEKLKTQLNQAQKMEAIGILAGGIAHDFNNILAAIFGYTEMAMEDAPPDSKFANDLDKVLISASRAKDLVKQILGFSRQSNVDRIPMKIQPLVKESLKMLRASIPSTIAIKENIHPGCEVILADPTQVHQIVMNLCTNASSAMEKTGGVLSIGMETTSVSAPASYDVQQLAPGEYVVLTVSDTGPGIRPDIIGKIFDPYFTTKEVGKGTGLGLSISHGIVTGYGGTITVESALGQGASFRAYFPVLQDETKEKEVERSPEAPRGQGRILYVDDEELLCEMCKDMLERLGYTVMVKSSSNEALAAFINDPTQFDLVITDQTMPEMTGADLARQMLRIRPGLPIILCTGFSNLVDEDSARAIGIREFALKPLTRSSIGKLIRKIFTEGAI